MRQLLKYIAFVLVLVLISAIDTALIPALGGMFLRLNLALVVGLFLVVIANEKIALSVYLLSTLISVLTSASLTITPVLIGGATLLIVNTLIESLFTNRSYYTLIALGIIGWAIYYGLFAIFTLILGFFREEIITTSISVYWLWGIIMSGAAAIILWTLGYIFTNYMSSRFKSYFIFHH